MQLHEAGGREETITDILWHTRRGMTAHHLVAQIEELAGALNCITYERSRINRSLDMIRSEQTGTQSPHKAPTKRVIG